MNNDEASEKWSSPNGALTGIAAYFSTPLRIGTLALVVSNILYFFPLWIYFGKPTFSRIDEYFELSQHLLYVDQRHFVGQEILIYRLFFPIIGYVLHLPLLLDALLPWVFEWLSLCVLAHLMLKYADARLACLAVILVSLTGGYQWVNVQGYTDSGAFLFMILCMAPRMRWSVALFMFAGALADERIVFAAPAIIFFRMYVSRDTAGPSSFMVRCVRDVAPFLLGGLIYAVYRYIIEHGYVGPGITHAYQSEAFIHGMMLIPWDGWTAWIIGIACGLRWTILPLGAAIFCLRKDPQMLMAFVGAILLAAYFTLGYGDVSRGIGYVFPAICAALLVLRDHWSGADARRWTLASVALNVVTPSFTIYPFMIYPLPLVLWRTFA